MPSTPRLAFVVSHTHWDREWYLSSSRFRVKLVEVVREVLDALENDDAFRHFVLDGQSIVLEDYLAVRPEDEDRLRRLVRDGALSIGPWYVLPDEFLVSGEALVRNLVIGHEVASALGRVQAVGYLPDSFGHVAQIPQILRRAGIDSFIYTRGNGDEIDDLGYEYLWRAPDGSEVLAINQANGYYNAAGLGYEEHWYALTRRRIDPALAVRKITDLFERMDGHANSDVYLLNNGSDHLPPQRELGPVLSALRGAFPGTEFRHGSFEDYVEALRASGVSLKSHTGELIRGKNYHILSGVWSARMYLKQLNDAGQNVLSNCLEPMSAYTHFVLGHEYPAGEIEQAWKLLLENHPHDSICGCSTDDVHEEMVPRFESVLGTAEQLMKNQFERIAPSFGESEAGDCATVVTVMNTLPVTRTEVVDRLVVLEPRCDPGGELTLADEAGRTVVCEIGERKYVERFWGVDYRSALLVEQQTDRLEVYEEQYGSRLIKKGGEREGADRFLHIRFVAEDLRGLGHANYFLRPRSDAAHQPGDARGRDGAAPQRTLASGRNDTPLCPDPVRVAGDTIDNEFYSVRVHGNGTFDVHDKATGRAFTGLNRLEDTEDVGDEYDCSPAACPETITSDGVAGTVRVVDGGGLRGTLEAAFALPLPESVSPDRSARSSNRVDCPVSVRVRLTHRSPVIEVELRFDNRVDDHRLRAEFPTTIVSGTLVSDGHFYLNRRAIDQPEGKDWVQPPAGTYPQQDFSLIEDGERGFAVLACGLPEIEPRRDGGGAVTLSLTLLRAVGWLSRDDFPTRRFSNAGPTLFTPGAQCRGDHVFRYGVLPFSGDCLTAGVEALSQRFRTPPLATQGVEEGLADGGAGLLEVSGDAVAVSAVKRHKARDTLVVRLWNLSSGPTEATLTFGRGVEAAWLTDLLEERVGELPVPDGEELTTALTPHSIVTIEISFRESPPCSRPTASSPSRYRSGEEPRLLTPHSIVTIEIPFRRRALLRRVLPRFAPGASYASVRALSLKRPTPHTFPSSHAQTRHYVVRLPGPVWPDSG
jgi:mannosylglycerate hydrolase